MRRTLGTFAVVGGLLAFPAVAGGGEDPPGGAAGPDAASTPVPAAHGSPTASRKAKRGKLTLVNTRFGRILGDRNGNVLYLFTADKKAKSKCRAGCATAWPPMKTRRFPKVGKGLKKSLVGITRRPNGSKQVTYKDKPLYFYVSEGPPGSVGCQNVLSFGGKWFVVNRKGKAIT
ncbi:MAG: COG4315 family predicted lipoprotein [Solirubrobacterales bacterium]